MDHALRLADLGWAVFPVVADPPTPDGKRRKRPHPMLGSQGGHHHATLDPEKIRSWWTRAPHAWIGSPTSLAIDIDTPVGISTAAQLGLRAGVIVKTPLGHHAHFKPTPEPVRGTFGGLIIRPPGRAWTVMPPSPGYSWICGEPVAVRDLPTLPPHALTALVKPTDTTTPAQPRKPSGPPAPWSPGLRDHVARQLDRLATAHVGERHPVLVAVARHLALLEAEKGWPPGTLRPLVEEAARRADRDPAHPFDVDEARDLVDWAWREAA